MGIASWLAKEDLSQFAQRFEDNGITFAELGSLTHEDLRDGLDIKKFSERKTILAAIKKLRGEQELELAQKPIDFPQGLRPEDMPTYLAHPWHSFCAEEHPRVKLHWLTDTAELAVRWAVSVTLAEILHANSMQLPAKLAKQIRDNVERPTLGRWLGVLRELSAHAPQKPVLGDAPFSLYENTFEPRFLSGNRGGSIENSLLVLRNQIAHGGGMSRAHASELLNAHQPIIEDLLRQVIQATQHAQVIAIEHDEAHVLVGISPQHTDIPDDLKAQKEGTWLLAQHEALPLLPLAIYGPVRMINSSGQLQAKPGKPVAQVFTRAYNDRLSYTPLGRDEAHSEVLDVSIFREVFRLDEKLEERKNSSVIDGVSYDDALKEARAVAEDLIGRKNELGQVKNWLKSRDPYQDHEPRLGWISGGPGLGKSMLMARLASDYGAGSQRGFYFHKFSNAGNGRSNRRMFLKFLETALWNWAPLQSVTEEPNEELEGDDLLDALEKRLTQIAQLEPPNPRAPRPQIWIFLDNFDEMIEQEPRFIDIVRRLAVPGTVWLMCGRPEHGLDQEFSRDDLAEHIFEDGVPMMSAEDIRAMLLEGLGQARYALLKRDEDDEDGTHNIFIENVVDKARGLPLYVELLLDDLRSGTLSVDDDDKLPDGLGAYYDGLMERIGLSTVSRDLPLIVSILARAEEPLEIKSIATLLAPVLEDVPEYIPRVQAALRVGQSLLKTLSTPEHTEGYLLYHQSFREYIGGQPRTTTSPGTPPAARLIGTVHEAEKLLYRSAERWNELPQGNLRNHLFRWGTTYALELQGDSGLLEARHRLTSYHYLHERLAALKSNSVINIVAEYNELLRRTPPGDEQKQLLIWEAFMRERAHIIATGDTLWPATKILFQLAMEHADTSPLTIAAEEWLANTPEAQDWLWLRKPTRPEKLKESAARKIFAGHSDRVEGAHLLSRQRLLSWSIDSTLKIWDFESGAEISTLSGHGASVDGSMLLDQERAVSWARDGSLICWNLETHELAHNLEGHEKSVLGVDYIAEKNLLISWSEDKTIQLWNMQDGTSIKTLKGHTRPMRGAMICTQDGPLFHHIISWSDDKTIRLWDMEQDEATCVMKGHEREVLGITLDANLTELVSWSMDNILKRFNISTGELLTSYEGHTDTPVGACFFDYQGDTQLLSWGKDNNVMRWSLDGELLATWTGHKDWIDGLMIVGKDRALTWSKDKNAIWWDVTEGKKIAKLEGHAGWVRGATQLKSGELLTWAGGGTMRVWDVVEEDGAEVVNLLAILEGHTAGVRGCEELDDERLLSWSWDGSLRVWEWSPEENITESIGHKGWIHAHKQWDQDRAVTWSSDGNAIFWDLHTGEPLGVLKGHDKSVDSIEPLAQPDRALTYSGDQTLAVWDTSTYQQLVTMEGHAKKIQGAFEASNHNAIVSWSSDATIKVWNIEDGSLLHDLKSHKKLVQGVIEFTPGKLVSWSSDATIKVWNLEDGALIHDLKEHKKLVKDLKIIGENKALSLSSDQTLRIWDLEEGTCLHVLEGHSKLVQAARRIGDTEVLSIGKDNCCILWDLTTATEKWRINDLEEVADGATLMDDDKVVIWLKKSDLFIVCDRDTGEELTRISTTDALTERPDIWRARQDHGYLKVIYEDWRVRGGENGIMLFHDVEDRSQVEFAVLWSETTSWSTFALHEDGIVTAHAGNYFYPLQLFKGKERFFLKKIV